MQVNEVIKHSVPHKWTQLHILLTKICSISLKCDVLFRSNVTARCLLFIYRVFFKVLDFEFYILTKYAVHKAVLTCSISVFSVCKQGEMQYTVFLEWTQILVLKKKNCGIFLLKDGIQSGKVEWCPVWGWSLRKEQWPVCFGCNTDLRLSRWRMLE